MNRDGHGPHDALVTIEDREFEVGQDMRGSYQHSDARWPAKCRCGYEFNPLSDVWQVTTDLYYDRSDQPTRVILREAPTGALWDAVWLKGLHGYKTVNGHCVLLRTPYGDWAVDGPPEQDDFVGGLPGKGWQRTGDLPKISATPHLVIGVHRLQLKDGFLEELP